MLPGKKYGAQDYVALAKRHWWIVASTTILGAFIALVVSSQQRNAYQSEMLVQIVAQRVPDRFVPSTVTVQTEDRMAALEAQVKSRNQLEKLILQFDLYPAERVRMPMEDVVGIMRSAITVDLIRPARTLPADAFYVRFTYADPKLAATVTTEVGNLFIQLNALDREKLADGTSQFLETQLAEAKTRLAAQEKKVEQFRQQHSGRLPTQSDQNMQAIQSLQTQLNSLTDAAARDRDRRLMVQRMYEQAEAEPLPTPPVPPQTTSPTEAGSTSTLPLKQQLDLARATLSRLEERLTDAHPDLRRQRRIVADLEKRVAAEPVNAATASAAGPVSPEVLQRRERLANMKAELESLDRQVAFKEAEERRVRATMAEYQRKLEAIPGVESEWIALTRDYDTLRVSYENLLRKSEDSKVAADLERRQGGEQFKIVDAAQVPVRPVGAARMMTNAVGTGVGFLVGGLIVALIFFRDSTFHSEADVLDVLALPVLGLVPLVIDDAEQDRRRRRRLLIRSAVAVVLLSGTFVAWSLQLWKFVA